MSLPVDGTASLSLNFTNQSYSVWLETVAGNSGVFASRGNSAVVLAQGSLSTVGGRFALTGTASTIESFTNFGTNTQRIVSIVADSRTIKV